jgi:SOS-response transcriptional repressor LexA
MNTIGERIKMIRKQRGMSQIELARRLGWQNSRMTNYEKGHRAPSLEVLKLIAKEFDCTIETLVGQDSVNNLLSIATLRRVPLISFSRAVDWASSQSRDTDADKEIQVVTYSSKPSLSAFALTVTGDSMTSSTGTSFDEGCTIIVDPERTPVEGDFVVARDPETNKATFKRLVNDAGRWYLKPLNGSYRMTSIESVSESVIGVVIESIQSQKF